MCFENTAVLTTNLILACRKIFVSYAEIGQILPSFENRAAVAYLLTSFRPIININKRTNLTKVYLPKSFC